MASLNKKHLGTELAKYIIDLYTTNYNALMKIIKEEINKWGDISSFY